MSPLPPRPPASRSAAAMARQAVTAAAGAAASWVAWGGAAVASAAWRLWDASGRAALRELYFRGPAVNGVGFWKGVDESDACFQLTRAPTSTWRSPDDGRPTPACLHLLEKDFQSFLYGLALVAAAWVAWTAVSWVRWRLFVQPLVGELRDALAGAAGRAIRTHAVGRVLQDATRPDLRPAAQPRARVHSRRARSPASGRPTSRELTALAATSSPAAHMLQSMTPERLAAGVQTRAQWAMLLDSPSDGGSPAGDGCSATGDGCTPMPASAPSPPPTPHDTPFHQATSRRPSTRSTSAASPSAPATRHSPRLRALLAAEHGARGGAAEHGARGDAVEHEAEGGAGVGTLAAAAHVRSSSGRSKAMTVSDRRARSVRKATSAAGRGGVLVV